MGSSSTERVSEEWINIYNRVLDTLHQRKNLSFVCKNKKWQFGRNTRLFNDGFIPAKKHRTENLRCGSLVGGKMNGLISIRTWMTD